MVVWLKNRSKRILVICGIISIFTFIGCQTATHSGNDVVDNFSYEIIGLSVALDFGPDGRLWRLIPTEDNVYVDYSTDLGLTYSQPVRVNKVAQEINAWPENPPVIAVSKSGRIHVLYYADEEQKATTFFSFSDDYGLTFSDPVVVSDHARTDMHYMDKMLVNDDNKVYLFWHDMRHQNHNKDVGAGVLSLYFTTTDLPESGEFINRKISDGICSCCRTAADFSPEGLPVVLARMVFTDQTRDHALIEMEKNNVWSKPQRITQDQWQIEACPEHGPALSIDDKGRSHLAWFTLGEKRQGIFYADTDDFGKITTAPMQLGNSKYLPSHPDVKAAGKHVVLAWKEYDGSEASIIVKKSDDRGKTWQQDQKMMVSSAKSGHPVLISNGERIFISWTNEDQGHQFIEVK